MEFDRIKAEVKKVELDTTRMDNDDYFEAVMMKGRLEGMVRVLEDIFGSSAWPSKKRLLKNTQKLIKSVGGLRKGQTLYLLNNGGGCSAFAMLWPWRDGERITIKISKV